MSKRRGAGEGSIYQRADGRWAAVVDLGWQGGKRRRKFIYGKARREVADKLRDALRAQAQGALLVDERVVVSQFLDEWLKAVRPSVRPSTWLRYEQFSRIHVVPGVGHIKLQALTPQHLHRLHGEMLAGGTAAGTVLLVHRFTHRALEQAMRWGVVTKNVAKHVDPPRVHRAERRVLTPVEAVRFLDAVTADRHEALYVLALTTGMRQGELLALHWADLDLERGVVQVRKSLGLNDDQRRVIGKTKTDGSQRGILLTERALEALAKHRDRQGAEAATPRHWGMWEESDLVFANAVGRTLSPHNLLQRSFHPTLERAGLPRIRFHDLRHTTATLLLSEGVHPKIVSEMLGHTQIAITLDLYSHVTTTMQEPARNALNGLLGSQRGSQIEGGEDECPVQLP